VNSYKSVRLAGKGYDISYTVQCHKNAHELYNMKKDPVQMRNLHPTAPAPEMHKNAFHSGEQKLAGFEIKRLLPRIDALPLVLKTCKGDECRRPWKQLHPDGEVKNLRDAMDKKHDHWYHALPKVKFNRCFNNGTIDLAAEGPQWHGQCPVSHNPHSQGTAHREMEQAAFYGYTEPVIRGFDENMYETDRGEAEFLDGWEGEEGYWDDWE
jgi:N-acetylglucosamine-6-sulfatase